MKKKETKGIRVDVDWSYSGISKKYVFLDNDNRVCTNPNGKLCAILKKYKMDNHFQNDKWGYLDNVLFTILDGTPRDFDGDLLTNCYLIRIESVL